MQHKGSEEEEKSTRWKEIVTLVWSQEKRQTYKEYKGGLGAFLWLRGGLSHPTGRPT